MSVPEETEEQHARKLREYEKFKANRAALRNANAVVGGAQSPPPLDHTRSLVPSSSSSSSSPPLSSSPLPAMNRAVSTPPFSSDHHLHESAAAAAPVLPPPLSAAATANNNNKSPAAPPSPSRPPHGALHVALSSSAAPKADSPRSPPKLPARSSGSNLAGLPLHITPPKPEDADTALPPPPPTVSDIPPPPPSTHSIPPPPAQPSHVSHAASPTRTPQAFTFQNIPTTTATTTTSTTTSSSHADESSSSSSSSSSSTSSQMIHPSPTPGPHAFSPSNTDENGDLPSSMHHFPPPHAGRSSGAQSGIGASIGGFKPLVISAHPNMAGHPNQPLSAKRTTPRDSLPSIPFDPTYAAKQKIEREKQREEKEKHEKNMFTHQRSSSNRSTHSGTGSAHHTPNSSMGGNTPTSLTIGTGSGGATSQMHMAVPPPPSPSVVLPPPPPPLPSPVSVSTISGVAPPTIIDETKYDFEWEPSEPVDYSNKEALAKVAHEEFIATHSQLPASPTHGGGHHHRKSVDLTDRSTSPRRRGGRPKAGVESMHTTPDHSPGQTPGGGATPIVRSREPSQDPDEINLNHNGKTSPRASPRASPRGSVNEEHTGETNGHGGMHTSSSTGNLLKSDKGGDKGDKQDKDNNGTIGRSQTMRSGSIGREKGRSINSASLIVPGSSHGGTHGRGHRSRVSILKKDNGRGGRLMNKFIRRGEDEWHDKDAQLLPPADHKGERVNAEELDDSNSEGSDEEHTQAERSAFKRLFGYSNRKRAKRGALDEKWSDFVRNLGSRSSVGMSWLYRYVHSTREKAPLNLKYNQTEDSTLWLVGRQSAPVDELYDHRLSLQERLHIERNRAREREQQQMLQQQQQRTSEGERELQQTLAPQGGKLNVVLDPPAAAAGGGGAGSGVEGLTIAIAPPSSSSSSNATSSSASSSSSASTLSPPGALSPVNGNTTFNGNSFNGNSFNGNSYNGNSFNSFKAQRAEGKGDGYGGGGLFSLFTAPTTTPEATVAAYNSSVAAALRREKGLVLGHGLTLYDVLATDKYHDMFRKFCEEQYCSESLEFLEKVEEYDKHHYASDRAKDLPEDQKWNDQKALNFADKLCEDHVSQRALRQINIDGNLRNALIARVNSIKTAVGEEYIQRMAGKLSGPAINKTPVDLFKAAKKSVSDMLDRDVFSRFVVSEAYNNMVQSGWGGNDPFKGTGFINQENFAFLEVFVLEAKGFPDRDKDATLYCILNVDTKAHKTKLAHAHTPKWDSEHVEFPILTTTQHVIAVVWMHSHGNDVCLGRIIIPFATIKVPFGAVWYKFLPREKSEEKSVMGELKIKLCLNKESSADPTCVHLDTKRVGTRPDRFQEDGYDLNLTYIMDRLIAMAYPDPRNMKEYQEFFQKRHGSCHKIYNLCTDRFYEPTKFHRVVRVPFEPGEPLAFDAILELCENAQEWLNEHPQNVVAIHCSDGREQTAFVVACYLVYSGQQDTYQEALSFFMQQRFGTTESCVTKPCELRYLDYVQRRVADKRMGISLLFSAPLVTLRALILYDTPRALREATNSSQLWFTVNCRAFYATSENQLRIVHKRKHGVDITECNITGPGLALSSDVHLEVFFRRRGRHRLCHLWFNTRFLDPPKRTGTGELISRLPLGKMELDKANLDNGKHFSQQFRLECYFSLGLAPQHTTNGVSDGGVGNSESEEGSTSNSNNINVTVSSPRNNAPHHHARASSVPPEAAQLAMSMMSSAANDTNSDSPTRI